MNASDHEQSQPVFKRLKTVCVPLMGTSSLNASSVPTVSRLLSELLDLLHDIQSSGYSLNHATIKYVFFPIYTLLNRNDSIAIPDQILEKIFMVLSALCEDWWWYLELKDWDQLFMLCGSVIGGIGTNGKGKARADETKEAAARCLLTLLRTRDNDDGPLTPSQVRSRMNMFVIHAQTPSFIPILGQTLNSVLLATDCSSSSLQIVMLDLLFIMLSKYFPDDLAVSVLPGVVSATCKLCLGALESKGWAKGAVVTNSLRVMQEVISRCIGDEPCIEAGAVVSVVNIEELAELIGERQPRRTVQEQSKYGTLRTPSWLNVTSSQLIIAMKSLSPLIKHPTPSALIALVGFSAHILHTTPTTLPQAQPLLLSYLLSLSTSDFPSVSTEASSQLKSLLTAPSKARHSLIRTLLRITRDDLTALPTLLTAQDDSKVERVAGIIEAICHLALVGKDNFTINNPNPIATEIGKLLGPNGGVEKWGWSLLSVLELVDPPITVTRTSAAQMMLESDPEGSSWLPFPQPMLKNVSSTTAYDSLVRMFHALGRAAGDLGLFSVEWFANIGQKGKDRRAVTGMWCCCRLLEGIAGVSLFDGPTTISSHSPRSKRLEKLARGLVKSTSLLWDKLDADLLATPSQIPDEHDDVSTQHIKGLIKLHDTLQITRGTPIGDRITTQPMLHSALSLQLISIAAGILESRFSPLFMSSLYPILHSLVSPFSFLSETALRALHFVTICTSYASPANLLLSNFDYVLDSVSRRLSRQWLDIDATKVLTVMIRLVGNDIVERAGDVVEECFDRLDEYHGYDVVVEGLVEVLGEVMKVIKLDELSKNCDEPPLPIKQGQADRDKFDMFFDWYTHRHETLKEEDNEDYGPAPRKAWGNDQSSDKGKGVDRSEDEPEVMPDEEPLLTASQALTKQIVQRSTYFLTHGSTGIRALILNLLSSSVPILSESVLMPSIHSAWPFILNRLADEEVYVASAAAGLVEALVTAKGGFMFRRIWDDVWPRFHSMLSKLETASNANALSHRVHGGVGTESVYTHSHRLYRSIINTMAAVLKGVDPQDSSNWEVIIAFRRFLHSEAAEELQQCARNLYVAASAVNSDAVWLVLAATSGQIDSTSTKFLRQPNWDMSQNIASVLNEPDL
ncbi:armadillo-type protein [Lentinula raphanica]|uniref:Armadillo-type protein n=1 Tax=Lentinula raphanica TaxID=153919 RepID=A0AA38PLM8_9AGAR|nr:armadillo-type protein [Lentinula raphanica]